MSKKESITFLRILGIVVIVCTLVMHGKAQLTFTDQAGGFGPYGGLVWSTLGQPAIDGAKTQYQQGFEVGIKSELYRFNHLRGNLSGGYMKLGAKEYIQSENNFTEAEVDLQAFKAALDPLLIKVGNDFIHGYAGGGVYGTFFIEQEVTSPSPNEEYWNGAAELDKFDYGVSAVAGVHVWNFDIEFKAQFGLAELGQRVDQSLAKQQFYSLTLAYLWVNQHTTVKTCKRKKSLRKVY